MTECFKQKIPLEEKRKTFFSSEMISLTEAVQDSEGMKIKSPERLSRELEVFGSTG